MFFHVKLSGCFDLGRFLQTYSTFSWTAGQHGYRDQQDSRWACQMHLITFIQTLPCIQVVYQEINFPLCCLFSQSHILRMYWNWLWIPLQQGWWHCLAGGLGTPNAVDAARLSVPIKARMDTSLLHYYSTFLQMSIAFNGAAGAPLVGLFLLGAFFPCANWIVRKFQHQKSVFGKCSQWSDRLEYCCVLYLSFK